MFWIAGADEWVYALHHTCVNGFTRLLATQMTHAAWEGFRFYDLIFPLFVFIAGVSLVFSLSKIVREKGKAAALRRVIVRAILLYLVGLVYYGGFSTTIRDIRLLGVLQRIALCYLFAGLLFIFLKPRWLVVACAVLLVGYWALMTFVPVPGVGAGHYEAGRNLANYMDEKYLPLSKWDGDYDPEGLLSTLPAIGTCLLGTLAGLLLRHEAVPAQKKVFWLCGAGATALLLGSLWGQRFPIVKQLWTSSYVLVAGGYSALLLALFYQLMEIWKLKRWAMPFVWIGSNALTLYVVYGLFVFNELANRLVGGPIKFYLFKHSGNLVVATVTLGLVLGLACFLYRRRIFIRL
jgi:predicted acyltransferase